MLHGLPPELISLILRSLSRDLATLRAVALTCRYFLPIARELLFAAVSCEALQEEYMSPYLDRIVDLRFRPPRTRTTSCHSSINEALQCLHPQLLSRLTTITFLGLQFWDVVAMPVGSFKTLSQLASLRELTLSGMSFLNLQHVQAFICALPNLRGLNLHRITYAVPSMARRFASPVPMLEVGFDTLPRLSRLAFSPDMTTTATSEIAGWLAKSPSAATLETIIVPYSSRLPQYVVGRFGPGVRHLSMPIHTLDKNVNRGQLDGYTHLRTLTVFMDSYNMCPGSWYLLGPYLERYIPSRILQRLTIDVRVEFQTDLSAVVDWAALDRVNDLLDDTKFDALQELEFIVQLKEELGWNPQEEAKLLLSKVEERLYNVVGAGKRVVTRYWRVDEFYDTIISLKPGVL